MGMPGESTYMSVGESFLHWFEFGDVMDVSGDGNGKIAETY